MSLVGNHSRGWTPTRRLVVLLPIVLLGGLCFVQSKAHASCGDYVIVLGESPVQGPIAPQQNSMPKHHSPASLPTCTGPNCQNQLPVPPLPKRIIQIEVNEQLAYLLRSCDDEPGLTSGERELLSAAALAGFPRRIDRPPRV